MDADQVSSGDEVQVAELVKVVKCAEIRTFAYIKNVNTSAVLDRSLLGHGEKELLMTD